MSDGSEGGRVSKTVLERWRESLQSCTSLSQVRRLCSDWLASDTPRTHILPSAQVFVHLSSLERSVLWSRSVLNARCRICRRKGDANNMLLCDGCGRGHHTHCLRPCLKVQGHSLPAWCWRARGHDPPCSVRLFQKGTGSVQTAVPNRGQGASQTGSSDTLSMRRRSRMLWNKTKSQQRKKSLKSCWMRK